jgi:hypothetical protein
VLAAVVVAFALATTVAFAQGSSTLLIALPDAEHVLSETGIDGTVRGQVVVSFHGDPASGCRARGVCGYGGTVIVRPGGSLDLFIVKLRVHNRIIDVASTYLGYDGGAPSTTARVDRSIDGRTVGQCVDAQQPTDTLPSIRERGRSITVRLFDRKNSVLATRCAGPRDDDLISAGPTLMLPIGRLIRGRRVIDLRGIRSFSAHGFAGTITSTVVLSLGKPRKLSNGGSGSGFPPGIKPVRTRVVIEHLSPVGVRGSITASFRGASDADACSLLDSCALVGTTTLDPISRSPDGYLYASGPARLPYRSFLVALGLRRGSPPAAIRVAGGVSWQDDGSGHEQLTAPNRCSDVARLGAGFATIQSRRTSLLLSYAPAESPTTECPGPSFVGPGSRLLSGIMPRTTLSSRTFTLVLRRGSSFQDDGYTGSVRGSLRLTFRRGRVTQQVITEPR